MALKITDVKINVIGEKSNNIQAVASIELEGELVVSGFKVMSGKNGLFVAMPSRKLENPNKLGKLYADTTYPLNNDFKKYLSDTILKAFKEAPLPDAE